MKKDVSINVKKEIADRIKKVRVDMGMSKSEFARYIRRF